jgi:hypothetical protein
VLLNLFLIILLLLSLKFWWVFKIFLFFFLFFVNYAKTCNSLNIILKNIFCTRLFFNMLLKKKKKTLLFGWLWCDACPALLLFYYWMAFHNDVKKTEIVTILTCKGTFLAPSEVNSLNYCSRQGTRYIWAMVLDCLACTYVLEQRRDSALLLS